MRSLLVNTGRAGRMHWATVVCRISLSACCGILCNRQSRLTHHAYLSFFLHPPLSSVPGRPPAAGMSASFVAPPLLTIYLAWQQAVFAAASSSTALHYSLQLGTAILSWVSCWPRHAGLQ
jgi:hypothetical protein